MSDLFVDSRLGDLDAQLACVKREIGQRKRVYPRQIAAGRMSPNDARREIETMKAVLVSLEIVRLGNAVESAARAIRDQNGHMLDHGLAADLDRALGELERFRRTLGSFVK